MEWLQNISSYAGAILTIVSLLTLVVTPLRTKFIGWITKTSGRDGINGKIDNLTALVEKSIEQNNQLQKEMEKQSEALQASMRNSILNLYYKCLAKGSITTYELQNLSELYANYKALNGNSFVSKIIEIAEHLPVKDNETGYRERGD